MSQQGHLCENELMTRDVEGAKPFYGKTIGWQFESMSMSRRRL
jgi:predicted enzyme related to lactoylglutathione lyase